ncbi:MAG: hypothetical protein RIT81_40040 [Deltaproteobacteria bacterium]
MHSLVRGARRAFLPLALVGALALPSTAQAAAGLYLQLGLGYAAYSGTKLVTVEDEGRAGDFPLESNDPACCASPGLGTQLRLGFSILGFGGPEFGFVGAGWNSFSGGAGHIGGGIRAYPLKFIGLFGLDTSELPIDMSLGVLFGYTLVGEDFAYRGTFWDVDFSLEYKLASFLSAGIKMDILFGNYDNFGFTSYRDDRGRCLDGVTMDQSGANGGVINLSEADAQCTGNGPSTTLLTPQVVFTFHFDILDL